MNNRLFSSITFLIFCTIGCLSIVNDLKNSKNDNIDITRAPFALSLRCNDQHICGAAIISTVWGITAAHCVAPYLVSPTNCSVRSGSTFKDKGGSLHNVTNMIAHENYNITNSDYDVSIFEIDPPFNFDSTTQSISLPTNASNFNRGTVIGWGTENETILSDVLKGVTVPLIEHHQCVKDYEGSYSVTPRQLCYGYEQGGTDACKGDSGGPLFNSDNILIGITSWGDECGEEYSPGVYTNILMMNNWIKAHANV